MPYCSLLLVLLALCITTLISLCEPRNFVCLYQALLCRGVRFLQCSSCLCMQTILPVGAVLQRLIVPDASGDALDVVLGYDDASVYAVCPTLHEMSASYILVSLGFCWW